MKCCSYCGTVFIWLWIAPMPPPEYNILMHQFNFNKEAVIQPSINHNLYHSLTGGRDYPGIIELDYIGFCEHNNIIWVQGSTLTRKIYKKYCPLQATFSMTQIFWTFQHGSNQLLLPCFQYPNTMNQVYGYKNYQPHNTTYLVHKDRFEDSNRTELNSELCGPSGHHKSLDQINTFN